jgi:uncharacterized protein (DUF2235 family)
MAHIAIFCDGTWNQPGKSLKTHVQRLAEACAETSEQKVRYFSGVGTGVGMMSTLGRKIDHLGGGLFGWGLNRNIKSAYLELCRIYQPGDRIMIFGFSRGAYTARSLAGMIRKCGILSDPTPRNVNAAFRLYRKRGEHNAPDAPHIRTARRQLSPLYATSATDVIERNDDSLLVRITYLGIWDTVGALGIPSSILGPVARIWNRRYAFHDTRLSSLVECARHAIALDEKRILYEPTLWNNLAASDKGPGLNNGNVGPDRPYQQVWFAGVHGTVGGSVARQGLAGLTLQWIWEGASRGGLVLKDGLTIPCEPVDPAEDAPEIDQVSLLYKLAPWLLKWRKGPQEPRNLHASVPERVAARADYRPGSLRRLLPQIFHG